MGVQMGPGVHMLVAMQGAVAVRVPVVVRPASDGPLDPPGEIRQPESDQQPPGQPPPPRRSVGWDDENAREIVLLTSHREVGATTTAAMYKDRWEIELFFKTLKQNLRVKTFVGTSENALRIQIWTALIALLLLKWLHFLSHATWSFSNMATMLRMNLFAYRDLLAWLRAPFGQPQQAMVEGGPVQLELSFPGFGQPRKLR